jgi:hypothetical protein
MNGGATLEEMFEEAPADVREYVFGDQTHLEASNLDVIVWKRTKEFALTTLVRISEALIRECSPLEKVTSTWSPSNAVCLRASRGPTGGASASASRASTSPSRKVRKLFAPNALPEQPIGLTGKIELLCSSANPAAHGLAGRLSERLQTAQSEGKVLHKNATSLVVSMFPMSIDLLLRRMDEAASAGSRLCLLLFLNKETFALNEQGDVVAQHVRVARALHLSILLVHDEESCAFETCMAMTPDDLVTSGLYMKQIAIPLGEHPLERIASEAMMLHAMQKFPHPNSRSARGSIGEFELGSLFGRASLVPASLRDSDQAQDSDLRRSASRGARLNRRLSSISMRRLSNASHAARLQQLTMAPPNVLAHHAHVARLAENRRRRASTLGKLTAVRQSSSSGHLLMPMRASSTEGYPESRGPSFVVADAPAPAPASAADDDRRRSSSAVAAEPLPPPISAIPQLHIVQPTLSAPPPPDDSSLLSA